MGSRFMGPAVAGDMMRNPALYRQQMAIRQSAYNGSKSAVGALRDQGAALALNRGRAKPESTMGVPKGRGPRGPTSGPMIGGR